MTRDYPQMRIRLPPDVKIWLEEQAQTERRSQNLMIELSLRKVMQMQSESAAGEASRA